MVGRIKAAAFSPILTLLLVSFVQTVSALSVHYELDRPYYYAGDSGRLLLVCNNDDPSDIVIRVVEMDIVGIGIFRSNMTGLTPVTNLPPGVSGFLLKTRQTASIEVHFRVPVSVKPGEYKYTWAIRTVSGDLMTRTETLRIYAVGEKPPPEPPNPFLLGLIALPILLIAYPLARWKSKKIAKIIAIGIATLVILNLVLGGFLFIFLVINFIITFYPLLILLLISIVIASILRRRGRREAVKAQKPAFATRPSACPR